MDSVSIVAVHGLGSNPDTAWLGSYSKASWLADFLPTTYKDFRIIAINHDSRWDAHSPVQSLRDYGQVILDSIAALRLDEEVGTAPAVGLGTLINSIIRKERVL